MTESKPRSPFVAGRGLPCFPKEARQNLCFLARERARERERKRTRNKNLKFFGYVHVYEHEHVHVVISKVRLWGRFCRASLRPSSLDIGCFETIASAPLYKPGVVSLPLRAYDTDHALREIIKLCRELFLPTIYHIRE
jgi:hypothetical protein